MQVLSVSIQVKPEHVEEFVAAMLENARGSRTEPGNLRYDLLCDDDDPNHFLLYEVYRDAEALEAHRTTPHFQKWAALVEPWLAAPRTRVRAKPMFYEDAEV
jgi:(4S)-4-hydroxy-5-phosphonooxypentane-2,3-dione isomerase